MVVIHIRDGEDRWHRLTMLAQISMGICGRKRMRLKEGDMLTCLLLGGLCFNFRLRQPAHDRSSQFGTRTRQTVSFRTYAKE